MNAVWFLSYVGMFFIGVIATLIGFYLVISHEEKKTKEEFLDSLPPPDASQAYSRTNPTKSVHQVE